MNPQSQEEPPSRDGIPNEVLDVLKTSQIGYLSVASGKGDLFSYPVAFYFSGFKIYFMTPVSAAKLRFIRANPQVSFLVDNHLLTKGACGAMIQGRAKVFSIARTVLNILSVGPKMAQFARKYPGMFTFYASGKELPDERKLYKYRLIRIDPKKVVYWIGYNFGRYLPEKQKKDESQVARWGRGTKEGFALGDPLAEAPDEVKMDAFAQLLKSADEELPVGEVPQSQEWFEGLDAAVKRGEISKEEKSVIDSYRSFLRIAGSSSRIGPEVTEEERELLNKWRQNKKRKNEKE